MKKSFIITSMAAFAALCFTITAQAQGPVVVSDKDDYSPGETAMFSAAGFQPNELLDFSIAVYGDDGTWAPDIAWADVSADASGGAEVDYVVPETWLNKTLQLTVMGLTSGLIAQTTFTDTVTTVVINSPTTGSPVHVTTAGATITANVTYTSCCNNANVHFEVEGTNTNYNGQSANATNVDYNVTVPAGLAVGCHDLHLQVVNQGNGDTTQTCAIIVDAPTTPTPTPTATPVNHPPVITCATPAPTPDLGQAIGCLGGNGFAHDFPVSYGVIAGTGNSKIVQATFTKADSTTVTVDVATVTDEDAGDTITVNLSNGTNPVTIVGPGIGTAGFTVHIEASDNHGANATPEDCGGTASAQIVYDFHGFFSPLDGQRNTKVKQGSGIPVKFSITDCIGTPITTGDHTIDVTYLSGIVPTGDPTVDDAGASGDNGINFRYDPIGMQWIFNLKTNSSYGVGDTYQIEAHLDDGTQHNVTIAIKR